MDEYRLRLKKYIELLFRAFELVPGAVRDIAVRGTVPMWYISMVDCRG